MSFLKSALSESDGKGSFTRLATGVLVLAALVWITRLVWVNAALPDFGGLTLFISALYGLNKASSAVDKLTENKPADCPPLRPAPEAAQP